MATLKPITCGPPTTSRRCRSPATMTKATATPGIGAGCIWCRPTAAWAIPPRARSTACPWIERDLATWAGDGRPVIICQHYGWDPFSAEHWDPEAKTFRRPRQRSAALVGRGRVAGCIRGPAAVQRDRRAAWPRAREYAALPLAGHRRVQAAGGLSRRLWPSCGSPSASWTSHSPRWSTTRAICASRAPSAKICRPSERKANDAEKPESKT